MFDNTKAFRTIIVGEQRRLAKKLVGISEAKPWSFDLAYWFSSQGSCRTQFQFIFVLKEYQISSCFVKP